MHADHVNLHGLREHVGGLDRLAQIAQVTAWLRHLDVPETMLVSIVMPTRNRFTLLERAVESVRWQSYANWELLVVDDESTDDTWQGLQKLAENDPRIRPFRMSERGRSSAARNHALDHADGDVMVYLDDDNRFDPDWCKAVAWAFTEYRDATVAYGARVIDDDVRHQGRPGRSMPIIQFNAWDRDAMQRGNLVDQNVIAHRPSPARFDPAIDHFSDWDLLLKLTDECDPLELPVLAAYYYSDIADRLSSDFGGRADALVEYVRARTFERRSDAP